MTPSVVSVDAESILVKPGDVPAPAVRFGDMEAAARYVAVASHVEGIYLFDRSCADRRHGNRFDVMAFADLVDAAMRDLRGANGWRILGASGDHTIWARPTVDRDTGEVYDMLFNVTRGEVPGGRSGYHRLESILRLKGIPAGSVEAADGPAADVRAVRAPDHAGLAAWHGLLRRGGEWEPAANASGDPIAYASPQAARAGAVATLEPEPARAYGR